MPLTGYVLLTPSTAQIGTDSDYQKIFLPDMVRSYYSGQLTVESSVLDDAGQGAANI